MLKTLIGVIVVCFVEASLAYGGSWSVLYGKSGQFVQEKLSDQAYSFTMAGMKCGVSASQLVKNYTEIFEEREIYCWSDRLIKIGTTLSINVKGSAPDTRALIIDRQGELYIANIFVNTQ